MNPLIRIPDNLIAPLLTGAYAPIGSMPLGALYVDPDAVGVVRGEWVCLFFVLPMADADWRCVCPRALAEDGWFRLLIPAGWNYPYFCEKVMDENRHETPEQFIERVKP